MIQKLSIAGLLLAVLTLTGFAQQLPMEVIVSAQEAPVFVRADRNLQPLRVAKQGSLLRVLKADGDWYLVEFQDPTYGRRAGFVEVRLVQPRPMEAIDLSVETASATAAQPTQAPINETVSRSTAAKRPASPNQTFQKARLSVQVGNDTKAIDAIVRFESAALIITDRKTQRPLKTLPYSEMTNGEYSFAKSPRWKTALVVSPLFLFTSGKKHWFLAQAKDDFALLHLDKENYRLVLAAFETKTGLNVETVADSK